MRWGNFFTKKIFIFLGVVLVTSGVIGAMVYLRSAKKESVPASLTAKDARGIAESIALADSDGDGLADWEEQLRGTDPHKSDTDGDGTPDGEEIRANRDPKLAGNDALAPAYSASASGIVSASSSINITAEVGKQLYSNLVAMEQFGKNDTETKKKLVLQTAEHISGSLDVPIFDPNTLKTTTDTSEARVRAYKQALFDAVTPFIKQEENELMLIARVIDTDDPTAKASLETLLGKYQTLITTLAAMEIPEDARAVHGNVVQEFMRYRYAIHGMMALREDALRSLLSAQQFSSAITTLNTVIQALGVYFQNKGIIQP